MSHGGARRLAHVGLGLLLAAGAASRSAADTLGIGTPVPDFQATSIDGRVVSLAAARDEGKVVIIVSLSTVCPYANHFAGHLRDLDAAYGPRGVLVVGVNSNKWESPAEVVTHARQHGFAFPLIKDEHHRLADRLGITRTPEALLIDATGRLRYRGWVKSKQESPDLQRALEAVLGGHRVPRPVTRAFGCAVDKS